MQKEKYFMKDNFSRNFVVNANFLIFYLIFTLPIVRSAENRKDPEDEFDLSGYRVDPVDPKVDISKIFSYGYEEHNRSVHGKSEGGTPDKNAVLVVYIKPNTEIVLRLFGSKLDKVDSITLSTDPDACSSGGSSDPKHQTIHLAQSQFLVQRTEHIAVKTMLVRDESRYYFCFQYLRRKQDSSGAEVIQQGFNNEQVIYTRTPPDDKHYYLPLPLQIIIIAVLLVLSGLFSGLNLGLMSLDKTELEIILKVGEKRERAYAEKIYPVRRTGNYLLCTLLLGNVIVNSAVSILFENLTSGMIALVVSTLGIVIFGEILPQAACSRYGLAVGAYTVYITRFFMILTAPLAYPISKILDWVLGEEVGSVYNKERLLELIRLSRDREGGELSTCQEVQIVTGALELSKKRVRDVMTNIRDVYMLPSDTILDPMMVSEIVKSGYTRIPVFETVNRHNIVAMLNVKDLALLDPEDKIPLTTICKFYQHPVRFVMEDTPLNVMLEEFKKGHYHLAMAQRINAEGEGDPIYEVVGLVSLEDILEEIIQAEIMDEFDIIRNNRRRPKRKETLAAAVQAKDVTTFFYNPDADVVDVSPQLSLATYQYLSTTLDAFRCDVISDQVLQRLIKQNVIRVRPPENYEAPKYLYQKDKECDYFILVLEGKATITVGESEMIFEPGPFHYFGYEVIRAMAVQAPRFSFSKLDSTPLMSAGDGTQKRFSFTPDFTLKISNDLVYLKITASTYLKAFRATLIERRGSVNFGNQSTSMMVLSSPNHGPMAEGDDSLTSPERPNGGTNLNTVGASRSDAHVVDENNAPPPPYMDDHRVSNSSREVRFLNRSMDELNSSKDRNEAANMDGAATVYRSEDKGKANVNDGSIPDHVSRV